MPFLLHGSATESPFNFEMRVGDPIQQLIESTYRNDKTRQIAMTSGEEPRARHSEAPSKIQVTFARIQFL